MAPLQRPRSLSPASGYGRCDRSMRRSSGSSAARIPWQWIRKLKFAQYSIWKTSLAMVESHIERSIEAVWRMESAKIIAKLARMLRDVGLAEELAQDALVTALEQWPKSGVPNNPGAWLMVTAKNRALDQLRRFKLLQRKHQSIANDAELLVPTTPSPEEESDQDVSDNF